MTAQNYMVVLTGVGKDLQLEANESGKNYDTTFRKQGNNTYSGFVSLQVSLAHWKTSSSSRGREA